jgi:hypothetical protein
VVKRYFLVFVARHSSNVEIGLCVEKSIYMHLTFVVVEEEQSRQLPFLDVMVQRQGKQLIFDVYRKPTSTKRYITADSFHPQSQKNSVFHSMTHRLCNFNLSEEKYLKKRTYLSMICVLVLVFKSFISMLMICRFICLRKGRIWACDFSMVG